MKRLFLIAALVLMALSFNSCEEDRWGYDNRVVFSAAGGDEEVDGDASIYNLSIGDGEGEERSAVEIAGVLEKFQKWVEDRPSETIMTIAEIEEKLGIKNLKIVKEVE